MILKVCSGENMADADCHKGCELFEVQRVKFYRTVDGPFARAWVFGDPEVGCIDIALEGNAYLMTDDGKTIQSFAFSPRVAA